jgi:hypothetical protein
MKLYYCKGNSTHYLVRSNPEDYATCINPVSGYKYESCFKNFEVAEKQHMFMLVGNNCKWLNIINRLRK